MAYKLDHFQKLLASAGFYIERLLPGIWAGRSHGASFQDVLVLRLI